MKWVQKGSTFDDIQDVEADRSAEGLLNYVNKKTGRSKTLKGEAESHVIDLTEDSFDAVALGEDIHTLVGFFAPWYAFPLLFSAAAGPIDEGLPLRF